MIPSTLNYQQSPGNGATTQFSFPNKIFQAADLQVTLIDATGTATLQVLTTQYTIAGIGADSGVVVTFVTPPPNGYQVDIRSIVANTQQTSIKNQGSFLPELHEDAFDKLTREVQDLRRLAYTFGIHGADNEIVPWPAVPSVANRKGTTFLFDGITGQLGVGIPVAVPVTKQLIAGLLYAPTAAETVASVTPTDLSIYAGPSWAYIARYGNSLATALAVAAASALPFTIYIDQPITVAANITVPASVTLMFVGSGTISVSATFTLTVNGPVHAFQAQASIFTGAGSLVLPASALEYVLGSLLIAGALTVNGALTAGSLNTGGNASVTGTLSSGAATINGGANTPTVVLTFSATAMVMNCALSNSFTTVFTANVTVAPTFTNLRSSQTINWRITQDGTGSRTMTWPASFKWPGAAVPTLSTVAGAVDLLTATYYPDTGFWLASLNKGFG